MRKLIFKKRLDQDDKRFKIIKTKKETVLKESDIDEDQFQLEDINKYKLDVEGTKSDSLYRTASKIYAKKVRIKYELELELSILKDEIAEDVRKNPLKWGLKKDERITDALINRIVVRDSEYRNINEKYIQAKSMEKEWEGIQKSLEQRSWMIKLLYEMWEKNYY